MEDTWLFLIGLDKLSINFPRQPRSHHVFNMRTRDQWHIAPCRYILFSSSHLQPTYFIILLTHEDWLFIFHWSELEFDSKWLLHGFSNWLSNAFIILHGM